MDPNDYIPMFLSESQEHLQGLNLAVVRLEESPDDAATIDEIFRIAHSLKGMSATMGFDAIAELTHEMENVFEALRQRAGGLSRDVVDTVLACLDALEASIASIETGGAENLNPTALIERLRALGRAADGELPPTATAATPVDVLSDPPGVAFALEAGATVRRIVVGLAEETSMPSVRAFMIFAALAEIGELVATLPEPELLEDFRGQQVAAWLASEEPPENITARVMMVSDVATIETTELAPPVFEEQPESGAGAGVALAEQPEAEPAFTATRARTVRVDAERLDQLMHFMGEVVIHRTAIELLVSSGRLTELGQAVQDLARSSQALQAMVMQVRMIPVEAVFLRFPRLVRDLSSKLGKEVELRLVGKDTELDRTVVDALGDPLVHLVRNALDHGLEGPDERVAAGKPRAGVLEIGARHAGGAVVIEVREDGRGIDARRVAEVAVERGLIAADMIESVDMAAAIELMFSPGFSTTTETNDISGRGVGMDAVRAKIHELGGDIVVDSTPGHGTCAQIRLPLTLAIVAGLIIEVGHDAFAVPIERVERTLRLDETVVRTIAGARVLLLEDGVIPLLDGRAAFGLPAVEHDPFELAVIVRSGDQRLAISVTDLVGQRELVTRPVPAVVSEASAACGGAVLSDGRVALIVDCDVLAARVQAGRSESGVNRGSALTPILPTTSTHLTTV